MTIKEIRKITKLSQTAFGNLFGIPLRTIQNWESGSNVPPKYVVDLIEEKILREYGSNDERND